VEVWCDNVKLNDEKITWVGKANVIVTRLKHSAPLIKGKGQRSYKRSQFPVNDLYAGQSLAQSANERTRFGELSHAWSKEDMEAYES
jgi:hypothetical protein